MSIDDNIDNIGNFDDADNTNKTDKKNVSKIYASDFACVYKGCSEQATAFYPIWDIDQETKPKPYCDVCLKKVQDEFLVALFLEKKSINKKQKYQLQINSLSITHDFNITCDCCSILIRKLHF